MVQAELEYEQGRERQIMDGSETVHHQVLLS